MALTIPISVPDKLYDVVHQRIRTKENETGKKANKSAIVVDLIEKGLKYEEMMKKEKEDEKVQEEQEQRQGQSRDDRDGRHEEGVQQPEPEPVQEKQKAHL